LREIGEKPTVMVEKHLATVFWHCRKNARTRGISMNLTRADLLAMWVRSRGRCELTRIRFDLTRVNECRRRPYAPSIDRIVGADGYSVDNCRLVVVAVNLAMNEWGAEVFARIAREYLRASKIYHNG
jgi:hypothetical protein